MASEWVVMSLEGRVSGRAPAEWDMVSGKGSLLFDGGKEDARGMERCSTKLDGLLFMEAALELDPEDDSDEKADSDAMDCTDAARCCCCCCCCFSDPAERAQVSRMG